MCEKKFALTSYLICLLLCLQTQGAFADIGPNVPLAGGVVAYQGFPQIAVNPSDATKFVASAISAEIPITSPYPPCNVPTPPGIKLSKTAKLYGSIDNGATWLSRCAPWNQSIVGGVPHADTWFETSPSVTYTLGGTAIAAYVLASQQTLTAQDGSTVRNVGSAIVLAQSYDNGASWTSGGIVDGQRFKVPGHMYSNVKIAVDTVPTSPHLGRTYVVAVMGNTQPDPGIQVTGYIATFASDDLINWTTSEITAPAGVEAAPSVVVGIAGEVYLSLNIIDASGWCTFGDQSHLYRSGDGGATWIEKGLIDSHQYCSIQANGGPGIFHPSAQFFRGANAFIAIDVDRNPASPFYGNLYATFTDYALIQPTSTLSDTDIYLRTSKDGGSTWSNRIRVNDDPENSGCTSTCAAVVAQFLPAISVDQADGSVNIVWYDSRNFAGNILLNYGSNLFLPTPNPKTEIYYARSVDGGMSVQANLKISDAGSNYLNHVTYSDELSPHWNPSNAVDTDPMGLDGQYGDYIGIVAAKGQVHPVWTDTRNFTPDFASPDFSEDISTAAVTNCAKPGWSGVISKVGGFAKGPVHSVQLAWSEISNWGVGATEGSFKVERWNSSVGSAMNIAGIDVLASALSGAATSFVDKNKPPVSVCYQVIATNNCKGTSLSPISIYSNVLCVAAP